MLSVLTIIFQCDAVMVVTVKAVGIMHVHHLDLQTFKLKPGCY